MSAAPATLIEQLAAPHRARAAFWRLLAAGPAALPAVREALHHPSASVRLHACLYLDHFVDAEALGDLIAMMDDPDAQVRCHTLHALACDRCKEGSCRPEESEVLPKAMRLLATDPDNHVRNCAVGLIGQYVHRNSQAVQALLAAIGSDASPSVRKQARLYAPGGTIYKRTAPKPVRVARRTR